MNKFEKQLEKWNDGTLRGAQAKLAKALHVSTATVALWATGKRHPSKGYVSKMAQLFKLDIYHVARLFEPFVPYQDVFPDHPALSLHDKENTAYPYSSMHVVSMPDMVTLPLFTTTALQAFGTSQPHEWWNIPRTSAQGASFLLKLPHAKDSERIVFICADTQWKNGAIMLARRQDTYHLVRVCVKRRNVSLKSMQGTTLQTPCYEPLGIVVRQVTTIN